MRYLRPSVLLLLVCAFATGLNAQLPTFDYPLAPGTVGVPYNVNFGDGLGLGSLPSGDLGGGISITFSFSATGALPPGISVRPNGLISGTPTTPGNYSFTLLFSFRIDGAPVPVPAIDLPFLCRLTILPGSGPQITIDSGGLSLSFTAGATAPSSQSIGISNKSAVSIGFSATGSTSSGGNWLTVSGGGTASAFGQGSITVTASPAGLPGGTYLGKVSIGVQGGPVFEVPVVMVISSSQQFIILSQTGLLFRAVSGGGAPPTQLFSVLNPGSGVMNWTATSTTLSGGSGWLSITPASGRSPEGVSTSVEVRVNPAGLAAGDYYGQIQIAASGVINSPQVVSVVLTVLPADANPGPLVLPTGLVFVGSAGGANPAAQVVQVSNLTSRPINYTAATFFENGKDWFTVTPKTGAVTSATPGRVSVQPVLTGLAAGVYVGELALRFTEDGSIRRVAVLLVVTPRVGTSAKPSVTPGRFADGCTPAKLLPVFTLLGSNFKTTAAWPTSLELRVVDDCGTPMTTGSVVVTFSSGDPAIAMTSLRDGRWTGTWQARNTSSAAVTITAKAQIPSPRLEGTASIGGDSAANASTPVIAAGGAVSAASYQAQAPIAPGSFVSIYGSHLAQGLTVGGELPMKTELNGTQVVVGGRPLPLQFTSDGQINAIVPYDLPPNSTQQMIVRRGASYSVPETVNVATAQPAVFTKDQTGKGEGIVVGVKADGTQFLVEASKPVTAGDVVVIYCAGLGPVDQPVTAGTASPSSPLARTANPVTVTIGGQNADVLFAGLAPGFPGLYQINAVVPSGVAASAQAALVVSVASQSSVPVTIAVE